MRSDESVKATSTEIIASTGAGSLDGLGGGHWLLLLLLLLLPLYCRCF